MTSDLSDSVDPPYTTFPSPSGSQTITPLESPDRRILTALRQIVRATDLHSRKLSAHYQITGPQLVCLITVAAEGPLTTSALARRISLSPSTVVGILDRLERRQLILRTRDQVDRRVVRVSATAKGRLLARRAPSPLQDSLVTQLQELPDWEQASIALALERVADLMGVRGISTAPILDSGPLASTNPTTETPITESSAVTGLVAANIDRS